MNWVLELNGHWAPVVLGAAPILVAFLLFWVAQESRLSPWIHSHRGLVGPFFVSVGLLFGLFAAFLGDDVWRRVKEHHQSLEQEADTILDLDQLCLACGDSASALREALHNYVRLSVSEEWRRGEKPQTAHVDEALTSVLHEIILPASSRPFDNAAEMIALEYFGDIRRSRATRRHIVGSHSSGFKWLTVMLLGFLTQVALIMIHLDSRRAQAAALTIFTAGFVVAIVSLAYHERPISGSSLSTMPRILTLLQE